MRSYALCASSGLLGFLGYVGFDQFYLGWIWLVPFLWAIEDATPRRGFFCGWLMGVVGHGGGFYWMGYLLEEFGGQHPVVAWLGVLGIGLYHGLSLGLWGLALVLLRRRGHSFAWTAPVAWAVMEHAFPFLFPMYLGAGQYRVPALLQIVELTGALGASMLVVFGNAVIHAAWRTRPLPWKLVGGFGGVAVAVVLFGVLRMAAIDARADAAPKLRVGIVQVNLGAGDKTRDPRAFFHAHRVLTHELLAAHEVDLVVWPESVVNMRLPEGASSFGAAVVGDVPTPLLFGVVTRRVEDGTLVP